MLDFRQVTARRGGRAVLDDVSFRVNARERVGVVGPNGSGKTTLFELIAGEAEPDSGTIQRPREIRLGYLRQQFRPDQPELSVLDYAEHALPEVRAIQHEIEAIEVRLATPAGTETDRDLRRLGELQSQFEHLGGYELRRRAAAALGGLGFRADDLHRPLGTFSGGWQMRAELTRALIADPDLLLLDEPTNYLDLPAVEWLQRYLRDFAGTLLLISHDRFLLNTLTTATLEVFHGRVTRFAGAYDAYVEERRRRFEQVEAARAAQAKKREQIEAFVARFRYQAAKAALVQSRLKMLERMEPVEAAPVRPPRAALRLAPPPPGGAEAVRLEGAGVSYDGARWVLRGIDWRVLRGDKVALVGFNGLGKTTLLRLLGGFLAPGEGRRVTGHRAVIGYQSQDFAETLNPDLTVLETVRAAGELAEREARTLLGGFLFSGDDADKPVRVLSGGEKMRLAFARLLARPPNVLLLDEPTTHLDIAAREALEEALRSYTGTVVLVSHDIEFVRRVATSVVALTPPGITPCAGGYDYYREKQATAWTAAARAAEAAARTGKATDSQARRRESARSRENLRRLRAPLQKALRATEARIHALEAEQADLTARFADPAGLDFAAASRRLAAIRAELPALYEAWERDGCALEKLHSGLKD